MNPKQAIITNLVAMLALGLAMFGINLSDEDQKLLGGAGVVVLGIINAVDNYIAHRKENPTP
jgi:hypothetical protein